MKIGISFKMRKNSYDRWGDEKYKKAHAHGFDCVDFDMANTDNELYLMSDTDFEKYLKTEKRLAQEAGIEICQTHGPWRWPPRDIEEADRTERMEKMKKSIRATAILGCKYWVVHPIMPFGTDDIKKGLGSKTWEMNISFMRQLLKTAKEYDVTICFENMPMCDFSLATPTQILKFVREINDENFKICLDTGHVAVFPELSPGDAVRETGKHIKVLHVHDNGGERDEHLPPYSGIINWADFSSALKEIGFEGVFSLETLPKENLSTPQFEEQCIFLAKTARKIIL